MKKSRIGITAVLLAALFMLSGCGDAMYELTEDEQSLIVHYAAQTLAKFNTFQQDGEVFVLTEILEGTDIAEESSEPEDAGGEEAPEDMGDEQEPSDGAAENETSESADMSQESQDTGATMTEALDLGIIQAEYMGLELCKTYQEEDYYAVDADLGKQFLVVKYNLVNQSAQAFHIDILAMTPSFTAVVNGEQTVPAQTTILLNDLSTYQSDIEPNGTKETVLLFQIPEDVTEVTDLQLKVTMNGNNFTVNL